ncbi:MAG: sn-glycerol-3-phosphate ABC transporter ATP-binding protein UgpC [Pseudomonadota bacterium]|nr:sn-glycerol-3-phosphate ABC transporter ATP-binding protein UgpC [Pseudomonadota bacterium]
MEFLKIDNVVKKYGDATVIGGVGLTAREGEFVVFVGPSGCGKSTLLRLIAGLDEVSDGRIHIDGIDVTEVPPAARGVAMVFQSYALYPHMNVRQNMSFGLKMLDTPADEIQRRVAEAARILKLEHLLERRPKELSGGQRQRVAIGRAIVRKPRLFLFDEPLSNLDAELRGEMRVEIARLHQDLGVTMVYVTHDQVEAMTLADRIVVLRGGHVEQIGTPAELYDHPVNTFVAGFIGSPKMNFLSVTVASVEGTVVRVASPSLAGGSATLDLAHPVVARSGDALSLGLRPEHLVPDGPGAVRLATVLDYVENLGGQSLLYTRAAGGEAAICLLQGRHQAARHEAIALCADAAHAYLFDGDGHAL